MCLDEEVAFIWKWRSRGGVTVPSLVYAFTRYGLLIEMLLAVGTNFPMSDLVRGLARVLRFVGLIMDIEVW